MNRWIAPRLILSTTVITALAALQFGCSPEAEEKQEEPWSVEIGRLDFDVKKLDLFYHGVTQPIADDQPVSLESLSFLDHSGPADDLKIIYYKPQTDPAAPPEKCELTTPIPQYRVDDIQNSFRELKICRFKFPSDLAVPAILPIPYGQIEGEAGQLIRVSGVTTTDGISLCAYSDLLSVIDSLFAEIQTLDNAVCSPVGP